MKKVCMWALMSIMGAAVLMLVGCGPEEEEAAADPAAAQKMMETTGSAVEHPSDTPDAAKPKDHPAH